MSSTVRWGFSRWAGEEDAEHRLGIQSNWCLWTISLNERARKVHRRWRCSWREPGAWRLHRGPPTASWGWRQRAAAGWAATSVPTVPAPRNSPLFRSLLSWATLTHLQRGGLALLAHPFLQVFFILPLAISFKTNKQKIAKIFFLFLWILPKGNGA